jgi:hypothetical protein
MLTPTKPLLTAQHDVVVEGVGGDGPPVAGDEAAAVDEDQHRPGGGRGIRHPDIEQVALGRTVFDVAFDLDALVGFLLLQRLVERGSLRGIDDAADLDQLPGDILRHRALLREG